MKIRASFVFITLIFSIPVLGQKLSSLEEITTLEEITKLLALQSSAGQKGLGPKKSKTKPSKTFDCGIEDGSRICSGGVIETFVFGIVKVCENGKMVLKRRTDLAGDSKIRPANSQDCTWRGRVYCDGDLVIDLYRWWFKMVCRNGKIRMVPRQWREVVTDSRFKP